MRRTCARALLPLVAALLLSPSAAQQPTTAQELDSQLMALIREGLDRPDKALGRLEELRKDGTLPAALDYAETRVLLDAGRLEAADQSAKRLAGLPAQAGRLQVLRALIDDRRGNAEASLASATKAVELLGPGCPVNEERAAIERGACDYRPLWSALRLLEAAKRGGGALTQAVELSKRALNLAQAGPDLSMVVLSAGSLALLYQSLDQPEPMQQALDRMTAAAEGDAQRMFQAMTYQAVLAGRGGNKQAQLQFQLRGLEFAQQAGAVRQVAHAQANLSDYYMHRGEPARALAMARTALPVVLSFKDRSMERLLRHNMSVALIRLHQLEAAKREMAQVEVLRQTQPDLAGRARELRELGEAMAESGQPREAIAVFHEERALTSKANERAREAALEALRLKYDSARGERDLELLQRDRSLKDQELANSRLAQQVGIAVGVLLALLVVLGGVMVRRVQVANKNLKANEALLRAQSERDPLTELANRRHFLAVMEQQAANQFDGALLMVDIDHFKHVNDRHGHAAGDIVICEVARRISHAVRQQDLVVRWGGEEFLVFAPGVAQSQLHGLAERILFSVGAEPVTTEDGPLSITVSIGFAHFPLPPMRLALHWEQAVNWADMALYTAKSQGRNRAMGIATVDAKDSDTLQQIEADFDAACSSQRVSLQQILGPQREG
ncbi:diguanylate cyclase [Paucibacter sp. JuS9]|uniref:GGDEF domain-containing protein n=1 Tax=Roseateles TaxID=93681 RepID=UPI002FE50C88